MESNQKKNKDFSEQSCKKVANIHQRGSPVISRSDEFTAILESEA